MHQTSPTCAAAFAQLEHEAEALDRNMHSILEEARAQCCVCSEHIVDVTESDDTQGTRFDAHILCGSVTCKSCIRQVVKGINEGRISPLLLSRCFVCREPRHNITIDSKTVFTCLRLAKKRVRIQDDRRLAFVKHVTRLARTTQTFLRQFSQQGSMRLRCGPKRTSKMCKTTVRSNYLSDMIIQIGSKYADFLVD